MLTGTGFNHNWDWTGINVPKETKYQPQLLQQRFVCFKVIGYDQELKNIFPCKGVVTANW